MKILKIKNCLECKHEDYFYDTRTNLGRFICKNPEVLKYNPYKIINRKTINQGKIPWWCPLEDYHAGN